MSALIEKRLNSRFSSLGEIFAQHYIQEMRKILQGFRIRQKKHNFWYYSYVGDCDDNDDNDNNDNENDNDSDNNDDNDNVDDQHEAVVSCTHWSLIGKGPYQYWSTFRPLFYKSTISRWTCNTFSMDVFTEFSDMKDIGVYEALFITLPIVFIVLAILLLVYSQNRRKVRRAPYWKIPQNKFPW